MNTIIQHETYHKFPSGVEYWTFLLSRPPLAFKVMLSSRSLKSDSVDAFCASSVAVSGKGIKKYQQKMISGAFCVVSISSEPVLLQVVLDVFTAARKRLLGKKVIKFGVVSHLGVIVDYFSHLLVPSALRVPLSLKSQEESTWCSRDEVPPHVCHNTVAGWCAVQKYFHWRRWFTQVFIGLWLWKRSISPLQPVHRFREEG